jgi:hypothetical protein
LDRVTKSSPENVHYRRAREELEALMKTGKT